MWITKLALRRPVAVMLLIITLLLFGISSIPTFHMEYIPALEPPMYVIATPYNGADPEIIDKTISRPVEEMGTKITGYKASTAISNEGQSMVILNFNYGIDRSETYLSIKSGIDALTLPDDATDPIILKITSSDFPIMSISVSSKNNDEVLSYVNDEIEPALEVLQGVGEVNVTGGNENYISIAVDPNAMQQLGVTFTNISLAIGNSDFSLPAGSVIQGKQDIKLSTSMDLDSLSSLKDLPITTSKGTNILLSDIATIKYSQKDPTSISKTNGENDISIGIVKTQDASIVDVARNVENEIEKIKKENPNLNVDITSNSSQTTVDSLISVLKTLLIAVLLVMFVLYVFLGDVRASLIVGSSIPISLLMTLVAMNMANFSLNVVTSTSLVMAIGLMVDNSIVVLDSIYKNRDNIDTYKEAAIVGVSSVGTAVIASTLTTIVVYFPLALLDGVSGVMFGQMGYTIIFAMIASIVSAITLVPYFYVIFKPQVKEITLATKAMKSFSIFYDRAVRKLLNRKKITVLIAFVLLIASFSLLAFIPVEVAPVTDEGILKIQADFRAGTDINQIDKEIAPIEKMLANDNKLKSYSVAINPGQAVIRGYVKSKYKTADLVTQYNDKLINMPNMNILTSSESSSQGDTGGSDNSIGFTLRGNDLDLLKAQTDNVTNVMYNIPGVAKVTNSFSGGATKAEIKVDPQKAAQYGLSPQLIGTTIRQINGETNAGKMTIDNNEYKIYVDYPDKMYSNLNSFMDIPLTTTKGVVKLSDIASIKLTDQSQSIKRANKELYVEYNVFPNEGVKKNDLKKLVNKNLDKLDLPSGVETADKAAVVDMSDEMPAIAKAIAISVFLVFLVMAIQFESPRYSIMIMMSVAFSFIGAFGLLFLSRQPISMTSAIGILMLMGIVVNNGILFVDTANTLKKDMPIEEALVTAGEMRMRPIFMTTLTTILSLIPVALAIGKGSETLQGVGIVIIGGLITSTILVLFLMPTFYILISRVRLFKKKRINLDV